MCGAYSSKAEHLIVDQKVAGSSPARRPSLVTIGAAPPSFRLTACRQQSPHISRALTALPSRTPDAASVSTAVRPHLRVRGHDPQAVAHFINRHVFCMFAEDVGLLPDQLFTRMLASAHTRPREYVDMAADLFNDLPTRVGPEFKRTTPRSRKSSSKQGRLSASGDTLNSRSAGRQ